MSTQQIIATIGIMGICVASTRALPFILFRTKGATPPFISYLGENLPSAVFGMLIVYCFKDVDFASGTHGLREIAALAFCLALHLWRRDLLVTIAGGTIFYMLICQMWA